ncbi:MAG: ATP synthase subunit I [Pseudomonadota bacterium]
MTSRPPAIRLLLRLQAVVVLSVPVLCLAVGSDWAVSALVGGLAYWLPNLAFAALAFSRQGARAAGAILAAFTLGEVIKLVAVASAVALALAYWPGVQPFGLLLGVVAAQSVVWLFPLVDGYRRRQAKFSRA